MRSAILATLALAFTVANATAAEPKRGVSSNDAAETEVEVDADEGTTATFSLPADIQNFCFFSTTPSSGIKYTVVRKLKVGKGTYGGVKNILPKLASQAKKLGADAIINYSGSQRFGFFPWRMVRPVVRGVAVKWSDPNTKGCAAIGGTTLQEIMDTDKPPSK